MKVRDIIFTFFIIQLTSLSWAQAPVLSMTVSPQTITLGPGETRSVTRTFSAPAGFLTAYANFSSPLIAVEFAGASCAALPTALVSVASFTFDGVTSTFVYTGCGRPGSGVFQFQGTAQRLGFQCPTGPGNVAAADNINCFAYPSVNLVINTTGSGQGGAAGKPITGQLSGSWYDPARSGEGFFIDVSSVSNRKVLVASWFTYVGGTQQYLVGSADIPPGASSVDLSMVSTLGTGFGSAFNATQVQRLPWGNVRLNFISCNEMRVSYNGNGQSGTLTQQRLVGTISDIGCN